MKIKITTTARKALVGGLATIAGAVGTAMADGDLTVPELIVSIGAGLVVGSAVWRVPNAPA